MTTHTPALADTLAAPQLDGDTAINTRAPRRYDRPNQARRLP